VDRHKIGSVSESDLTNKAIEPSMTSSKIPNLRDTLLTHMRSWSDLRSEIHPYLATNMEVVDNPLI